MPLLSDLARRAAPYLIAAAVVAAVLFGAYRHGVSVTDAEWTAKWNAQAAALATAKSEAEAAERLREQGWQTQIERVRDDAQREIDKYKMDLAAADASVISVRDQAKRLAERTGSACQGANAADAGKAARATAVMLADLFARADQRANEMAAYADRARAAGTACERAYDAVRGE